MILLYENEVFHFTRQEPPIVVNQKHIYTPTV